MFTNRQVATFYFQQVLDAQDELVAATFGAAARVCATKPHGREEQLLEGIACVVQHVKPIMRSELSDHFGLKLDGWLHNSEHYLAVFVCYELDGQPRCQLLAMAHLVQAPGQDLSAQGHVDFLRDMLSQDYGKTCENFPYLVGDNCATNRRLATLMGVPLVVCASHRLNLATQSLLENFTDKLAQVRDLMIKLESLNQSAKLRYLIFSNQFALSEKWQNSNVIFGLGSRRNCDRY
ncbi:Ribonuclease H-like domain [Phytophthora cactorum]|nr:Ribonuclease H-like domain [Phytophthora cactorum]